MKKIFYVFLVFSALALIGASAYADGDESDADESETEAFSSGLGAQVRLDQLELSIDRNIAWGEAIIAAIKEENLSDTGELEALLAELRELKEEVADTTPSAGNESAKQFVDLKHDAIELTREFRELVHKLLKESDIQGMKRSLGWINSNKTREYSWRINESRNKYNAEKTEELLKAAGITDPALIEKVRSGNMSAGEVKNAIRNALGNKTGKERSEGYDALAEKAKKGKIFARSVQDRVKEKEKERAEERVRNRIKDAEDQDVTEQVREQLRNQTRLQERINRTLAHIDYMTAKKIGKLEGLGDKLVNYSERKTGRLEEQLNDPNLPEAERARVEAQIEKSDNKAERIEERTEARINRTQEKGEHSRENAQKDNNGNGNGRNKQ